MTLAGHHAGRHARGEALDRGEGRLHGRWNLRAARARQHPGVRRGTEAGGAGSDTLTAAFVALRAVIWTRVRDLAQAREVAGQFAAMVPANTLFTHTLDALVALQASDMATYACGIRASSCAHQDRWADWP
jgi:hypothetical protein